MSRMRSIAESDESGQIAVTTFEHDARRRLCRETRVAADPQMWSHELSYTYDDNGNRRSEHRRYTLPPDEVFERNVTYVYDLDDPATYGTMQNRLMAVSGDESRTYYYDEDGNVWRIIEGSLRTDLEYDKMGRVWRAWGYNQGDDVLWAHEFRYAGARRRYLVRELDPDAWEWHDVRWSDYLGNSIWGDYTVDGGTATMTTRYVPGLWQTDLTPLGDDPPGAPTTAFVHTNQLGTTRLLSDESGSAVDLGVGSALQHYTAFGRPFIVDDDPPEGSSYALPTRYGYAGAWGYDSQSGIGALMHVGARYYDPRIGRFLQRDPIGISGGLNVYAYVENSPANRVDPSGHGFIDPFSPSGRRELDRMAGEAQRQHWERMHPPPAVPLPMPAKPLSPAQELERLKRDVYWVEGTGALAGAISCGATALGVFLANVIDQLIHYDEPLNPLYGGSYEDW